VIRRSPAAVLVSAVLLAGACATTKPPISKIVDGRVIMTRSVDPNAYEHVARALLFEEEERYDEAITELERSLNFDRDAPEIHARIAEVYLKLSRLDDAEKAVRASLKLGTTVDGLIAEAHLRQRRGDHPGAVASLRRATSASDLGPGVPEAVPAYLELADAQLVALDIDGARTTLRQLADGWPTSTVARVRLAAVAWTLGASAETERRLREALRLEPGHIEALLTLAWLHTADGRNEDAQASFRQALERSEGALDVAAAFARFLIMVGKKQEAADLAEDLAGGEPDDETVLGRIEVERAAHLPERALTLARARRASSEVSAETRARLDIVVGEILADKDPAGAAETLLRVPRNVVSFAESRLRAAEIRREQGQLAEAAKLLAEAEASSPGEAMNDELAAAWALLEEKKGSAAAGLRRLEAALEKRPGARRLRLARAALLDRMGRWREALAGTEEMLNEDPSSSEALNFWGFVAADHDHDLHRARQRIRAALAFDPGSGAIIDSLGWAHLKSGELSPATLFLEQAGRLEPDDPEILLHLAELYLRKGDRARAAERLQKALAGKPEDAVKRRLLELYRRVQPDAAGGKAAR
jgi:tetratricopeptide (TPR) repeat protein